MSPEAQIAVLTSEVGNLKDDIKELRVNMDAAGKRLTALERYVQWFIGAAAAVGFLFGLMADFIKEKIGHG